MDNKTKVKHGLKAREIVSRHDNINEAVKELLIEGIVVTNSQGRRLFHLLKNSRKSSI